MGPIRSPCLSALSVWFFSIIGSVFTIRRASFWALLADPQGGVAVYFTIGAAPHDVRNCHRCGVAGYGERRP